MSIYVGNLSYEVKEDDIKGVFAEYGTTLLGNVFTRDDTLNLVLKER